MPFNSQFTPTDGLLNTSAFPTQPASEEAARQQFMDFFNLLLGNDNFLHDEAIIEIGSNTNGGYVKFGNGLLICYKYMAIPSVPITAVSGTLYKSDNIDLGSTPVSFTDGTPPIVVSNIMQVQGSYNIWKGNSPSGVSTNTTFGKILLLSAESVTATAVLISCFAIGKWK